MTDEQRMAITDNNATPGRSTKPERDEQPTLGREGENPQGLVNIPGPLLVRITRRYSGRSRLYDDDNFQGGCKELRDSIASTLGLKGDSAKDGIIWEYRQEKGGWHKTYTAIETFSKKTTLPLDK